MRTFVTIIFSVLILRFSTASILRQRCNQLPNSVYYRRSCFVKKPTASLLTHVEFKSCIHFGKQVQGHGGILPDETYAPKILAATAGWLRTAGFRDRSVATNPKTGWYWLSTDSTRHYFAYDSLYWTNGQPDNINHNQLILGWGQGFGDWALCPGDCGQAVLCQYRDDVFYMRTSNMRATKATFLSESGHTAFSCTHRCHFNMLCQSFSLFVANGTCQLHSLLVGHIRQGQTSDPGWSYFAMNTDDDKEY